MAPVVVPVVGGNIVPPRRAEFVCLWFVSMYFRKLDFVCNRAVKRDAQLSNKRAANLKMVPHKPNSTSL